MPNSYGFLRSVFSGPDGGGSSTRLCMVSLVSFVIGAGVALVCKLHTPVTVTDLDNYLAAAGLFIATTCGPLYLINKGADAVKNGQDIPKDTQVKQ
jgi:hypothetical protein